ncbi:hypothetical protein AB0B21_34650 [Streptomyces rimosus]|uniref:hypothetical protein n=1 Tax=Streptomyces rimosus TaxID=1927 RepID=UPI000519BB2A|nr:hypothetical protein [Streptomyces rimosus]
MTGGEQDQGRAPESTWDHSLSWGALMIYYLEKAGRPAPTEEWELTLQEPDRLLVNVLLAAAVYEQATTSVLIGAETDRVLLCAPQGRGVTGLLTKQALKCVEGVPNNDPRTEWGRIERIVLAEHAGRPTGRDLWERVLRVTRQLAATVARDVAGERYWETEMPLADFRTVYQRMLQHRDIADALGDQDY